jgi:hypothetical protein
MPLCPPGRSRSLCGLLRLPVFRFRQLCNYPANRLLPAFQSRHKALLRDAVLPLRNSKSRRRNFTPSQINNLTLKLPRRKAGSWVLNPSARINTTKKMQPFCFSLSKYMGLLMNPLFSWGAAAIISLTLAKFKFTDLLIILVVW